MLIASFTFTNKEKIKMEIDPLQIKKELIEEYKKRKTDRVKSFEEMGLKFERSTFDYFNELEGYKEESNWLIKIRKDLSDIEFPPGVSEYAIACPDGIYMMVMELKRMYLEKLQ